MSRPDLSCRRCGVGLLEAARNGFVVGYGGRFAPGVFCSPTCRDLNDQVWDEWYAPQRQSVYRVP